MNSVTNKPAIKKDKKFDFVKKFEEGGKIFKSTNPPLPVKKPKPPAPEELDDFLNYEEKIAKKKAITVKK